MSKKNKIQKQLLRAQIQSNLQAVSSGKNITQAPQVATVNAGPTSANTINVPSQPKENTEAKQIKKGVMLSFGLSVFVLISLAIIYVLDLKYGFLQDIANQLFDFIRS